LIVIDTLQKVRKTVSSNVNPYATDYDDITALKQIGDICAELKKLLEVV
jgi:hypothetical protein